MSKLTLGPLIRDLSGRFGPICFTHRSGKPVLALFTPATNQDTPARLLQRDLLRLSAAWWAGVPADMRTFCRQLADEDQITAYDLYTWSVLHDLGAKPVPQVPTFFPPVPAASPLLDIEAWPLGYENYIIVIWWMDLETSGTIVRFLAVELEGEYYGETLIEPVYTPPLGEYGVAYLQMPKAGAEYLLFAIQQAADGTWFTAAQWVYSTS